MFSLRALFLTAVYLLVMGCPLRAATEPGFSSTKPNTGLRDNTPRVHALIGARIVVSPDRIIERGTLVIRDGVVAAVNTDPNTPVDARVWDMAGKTLYPGFIDAYSETATKLVPVQGTAHWNALITPQCNIADIYVPDAKLNEKFRSQGITARLLAPSSGIIQGTSALVSTSDETGASALLKPQVAMHVVLTVLPPLQHKGYPASPMGAVALARQTMLDADWYTRAWRSYEMDRTLPPPERNDALEALARWLNRGGLVIARTLDEQYFLRADAFAQEFGLNLAVYGSGREYERLESVRKSGRLIILPLTLPKAPRVSVSEIAFQVPLEALLHWDLAPENPARLEAAGIRLAFSSQGLPDVNTFLNQLRKVVSRGLSKTVALRAITTAPAELFGVDRLGTLEPGSFANIVVTDGDLFDEKTRILETWISGNRFEPVKTPLVDLRGRWELKFAEETDAKEKSPTALELSLGGTLDKLHGTLLLPKEGEHTAQNNDPSFSAGGASIDKTKAANKTCGPETPGWLENIEQHEYLWTATLDGKHLDHAGTVQISALTINRPGEAPSLEGRLIWPDQHRTEFVAKRLSTESPFAIEDVDGPTGDRTFPRKKPAANYDPKATFAVNYPFGAFGRLASPEQPKYVVFQNAKIWTCGPQGVLENASLLVKDGKIAAIGKEIEMPAEALVIDCKGQAITPGIVDCHAHLATDGGINEMTQAITAEVRIGDFIDAHDINLYRQLAGGVTCANILHGSANPIGGQNQVIKFRWGGLPDELKFADAPPGIKFALGENVKQSNWGDPSDRRYPQTRMGVEQVFRDAFQAAREYQQRWQTWEQTYAGAPPRRDLELEALVEILEGKRWIHCHSYRQDEILAMLRVLEDFKVRIGTLQHVLEGYKVADAMAQHGAMGSTFADWWAYKFEVYDAIPFNGALMHRAGVVVSFNSDSPELARHLNQEAGKAVKYGGVSEEEALKFVTINPARQLRIEKYVGSLEMGKDADLAIWNGPPLSPLTRCEQTWVDGKKYFDRAEDAQLRTEMRRMRETLIEKILASGEPMIDLYEQEVSPTSLWPREDTACHDDGHDHAGGE